jgi:CheY-like chemotaxis protein
MANAAQPVVILTADDDPDDRLLIADAWREGGLRPRLHFVEDGEELMDYLNRRGRYTAPTDAPQPSLILLDLNMPKKDGREALREIKGDPRFRRIPVVVLTTSEAEDDVARTYDLGVNSFIVKPSSFDAMVELLKTLNRYWFEFSRSAREDPRWNR